MVGKTGTIRRGAYDGHSCTVVKYEYNQFVTWMHGDTIDFFDMEVKLTNGKVIEIDECQFIET